MPNKDQKKTPYKTSEELSRLDDRVPELDLDASDDDDLRGIGGINNETANFKSELDYDGYNKIEDYDNNAYSAKVANDVGPKELKFDERLEDDSITEENAVDTQQNHDRELDPISGA